MKKKLLTLLLAVSIVGLYTFGDAAAIFATSGTTTEGSITTSKTASWKSTTADKDSGIAHVKLTVNVKNGVVVKTKKTRIVLVLDTSGSMATNNKDTQMKSAAKKFASGVIGIENADVQVAVVSYSNTAVNRIAGTGFSDNLATINSAIDQCSAVTNTGTNTQAGIYKARQLMSSQTADNKFIVVLSDGEPTYSFAGTSGSKVTADTKYNYNNVEWPTRISSFDYSKQIGNGSDYEIYDYTATNYNGNTDLSNYYYQFTYEGGAYGYTKINKDRRGNYYINLNNRSYYFGYDIRWPAQVYAKSDNYNINNGYGAVGEAYLAKADGNTMFSIGFDIGTTGHADKVMKCIASQNSYSFNTNSNLDEVFASIKGSIEDIATGGDATVTDVLGSNGTYQFEAVAGSQNISAPEGMAGSSISYNSETKTYTWVLGTGTLKAGDYTLEYDIDLNIEDLYGTKGAALNEVLSNNSATLSYKNLSNQVIKSTFEKPTLAVTHYNVEYYYSDDTGKYAASPDKTETATAIVGCSNITLATKIGSSSIKAIGERAGYDYEKSTFGTSNTATSLVISSTKANNVVKVYYKKYIASGTASITAKKIYNKPLIGEEFSFQLQACDSTGVVEENASAMTSANAADGSVAFDSITYNQDQVGTHYYKLTESIPAQAAAGLTYSHESYLVKVVVKDQDNNGNKHNGTLSTEVTYKSLATNAEFTTPTFTNTYAATATGATITLNKVLEGKTLEAGMFHFNLVQVTDATGATEVPNGTTIHNVANAADGSISFTGLTYATDGTYYYAVTEVNEGAAGYTYDTMKAIVTVTVTDTNAVLSAVVTNPTDSAFNNSYNPADSNSIGIHFTKALTGKTLTDGMFTFSMVQVDDANGTEMANATPVTASNAGANINFANMTFDKAGTYYYAVTEDVPEGAVDGKYQGMTYDTSKKIVTVNVVDNHGQLEATATYPDDTEFNNSYAVTPITDYSLTFHKTVNGVNPIDSNMFSFDLVQADENWNAVTDGTKMTATNGADGTVTFANMTFSAAGTYRYLVSENASEPRTGYTYDSHKVKVTVVVTDNGDGTLTASDPVYEGSGTFENSYEATPVTDFSLNFTKALSGATLTDGEFTFELTATAPQMDSDIILPMAVNDPSASNDIVIKSTKNDAAGKVVFGGLSFSEVGTYYYKVSEVNDAKANFTYDTMVATVIVTVTDDHNGHLVATAAYPYDTEFNNSYTEPSNPPIPPNPPVVENTTYTVVANYFTSTDNGTTYAQDNTTAVEVKGATTVTVGSAIAVTLDAAWANYNSNTYVADTAKSTLTGTAVADATKNVLVVNYYRITGNNDNGGDNNNNGGNTNNNSDNNNSGNTTNTASNSNAVGPTTGDSNEIGIWIALGLTSMALAGVFIGLRKQEDDD